MKDLAEFDREETTELRKIFWQIFIDNQFIKSTNSITDEVEEFECGVIDMEATVDIRGEFDKDQIEKSFEEWIKSHDARRDAMMRKELLGRIEALKSDRYPIDTDASANRTIKSLGRQLEMAIKVNNTTIDRVTSIIKSYGTK